MTVNLRTLPLDQAVEWLSEPPVALLSLGIPRCPASRALEASLEAISESRPRLPIARVVLATPDDWALRETVLWPRGIRVSRSSVPVLSLLRDGRLAVSRHGSAPAHVLDEWLSGEIGPATTPPKEVLTRSESAVLEETALRRAQHRDVKSRREPGF